MIARRRGVVLLAASVLPTGLALADPPPGRGQGRGGGQGNQGQQNQGGSRGPTGSQVRLRIEDGGIVRDYWTNSYPGWSPRPLPPGQVRQLARGKPLPPGLARRTLPPGLLMQLPSHPGYSYAMVGTALVLLGPNYLVVDIVANLF